MMRQERCLVVFLMDGKEFLAYWNGSNWGLIWHRGIVLLYIFNELALVYSRP